MTMKKRVINKHVREQMYSCKKSKEENAKKQQKGKRIIIQICGSFFKFTNNNNNPS